MSSLYQFHSIRLVGASSVVLCGLTQVGMPQGLDIGADPTAGSPHPRVIHIRGSKPVVNFTTRNIHTLLGLTGSTSLVVKSGGTYTAFEIYLAKVDDCGRPLAGEVHRKYSFAKGCIVPRVLSASSGADAELTADFLCLSADEVTVPVTITDSVALPSLPAVTAEERYTIGPMQLEAIAIDLIQQLSIDFGNTVQHMAFGSAIYPTHLNVDSQVVRMTFTSMMALAYDSLAIPIGGLALTHADTIVWLRQRKQGEDALYADNETEHLKLTMAGLAVVDDPTSGNNNSAVSVSGSVTCQHDGTNAPITITVNQAIA